MGTSSAFGGAGGGTPLVPSWIDGAGSAPAAPSPASPPAVPAPDSAPASAPGAAPAAPATRPTPTAAPDGGRRFSDARRNFSTFTSSGGSDRRSLGRAVGQYVSRSSGGASNAARRMGSSRASAARLAGFFGDVRRDGLAETLRSLDLGALAGQSVERVFAGLADYICPEGGSIDEGIAREAFIETVADLAGAGIHDMDSLTPAQMQTVFELYTAHTIEARICNDIGTRMVTLPSDPTAAERVQAQLHDFIVRGVSDALDAIGTDVGTLTPDRVNDFVANVYESAFEILQVLGEAEEAR
jgi:hypothetical protein